MPEAYLKLGDSKWYIKRKLEQDRVNEEKRLQELKMGTQKQPIQAIEPDLEKALYIDSSLATKVPTRSKNS